jgi:hypothetical protein
MTFAIRQPRKTYKSRNDVLSDQDLLKAIDSQSPGKSGLIIDRLLQLAIELGTNVQYGSYAALVAQVSTEIDSPIPHLEIRPEYPFPALGVPRYVYRWCSTQDARNAVAHGIAKAGGVHDGIPTLGVAYYQKGCPKRRGDGNCVCRCRTANRS